MHFHVENLVFLKLVKIEHQECNKVVACMSVPGPDHQNHLPGKKGAQQSQESRVSKLSNSQKICNALLHDGNAKKPSSWFLACKG